MECLKMPPVLQNGQFIFYGQNVVFFEQLKGV